VCNRHYPRTHLFQLLVQLFTGSNRFCSVTGQGLQTLGFDLKLLYNSSIATATSVTIGAGMGGTLTTNLTVPGEIGLGWFTFPGVTLADGSVIFTINFTRVPGAVATVLSPGIPMMHQTFILMDLLTPLNDSPFSTITYQAQLTLQEHPERMLHPQLLAALVHK